MSNITKSGISPSETRDPLASRWIIYNLVASDYIQSGFQLQAARESIEINCKRLNLDRDQVAPFVLPKLRLDKEIFERVPSASDLRTLRRIHEEGFYGKVRKSILNDE